MALNNGVGASIHTDLQRRKLDPDNVRTSDPSMNASTRKYQRESGCAWSLTVGAALRVCDGPADWPTGGKWWCLDHIDEALCCGARLSAAQRKSVIDRPDRKLWLVRQRQLAKQSDPAVALGAFDKQFPDLINDPDEHSFSWREHVARTRKKKV